MPLSGALGLCQGLLSLRLIPRTSWSDLARGKMAIGEECLANFKAVHDGTHFAFLARQHLLMGHIPVLAEDNIAEIRGCLEGMKDSAEYNQAMDLVEKALKYAKTNPEMAIGYLIDVEPLIEQGALQKAVSCECGENRGRKQVQGDKWQRRQGG
ncbi:hypothetical protein ES703_111781 [subsurface metagenome]